MSSVTLSLPAFGDAHWKAPVVLTSLLPSTGNVVGDVRYAEDTKTIYVWDGVSAWVAVATPGAAIALDGLIGDVLASGPGVATATVLKVRDNFNNVIVDGATQTLSDASNAVSLNLSTRILVLSSGATAVNYSDPTKIVFFPDTGGTFIDQYGTINVFNSAIVLNTNGDIVSVGNITATGGQINGGLFNGDGGGLTGTASNLNIGGTAASASFATFANEAGVVDSVSLSQINVDQVHAFSTGNMFLDLSGGGIRNTSNSNFIFDVVNGLYYADNFSSILSADLVGRILYASDGTTPIFNFSTQGAAVADATNATDVITQLNALLSRIRALGLIAT